jgi:DMSO reductase family type II enzyme heme b subunit
MKIRAVNKILVLVGMILLLSNCQSSSSTSKTNRSIFNTDLRARFLSQDLPLDPLAKEYKALVATEVSLFPQLLVKPFGADEKPPIQVKAVHNNKDIIFLVEWEDKTEDREEINRLDKFPDACALMLPQGEINDATAASLMMGFLVPVEIWYWKSGLPAENIRGNGPGTLETKQTQPVLAKGFYSQGKWHVIFKRPLDPGSRDDFYFKTGTTTKMAFAVWDGAKQERGPQKSISDWIRLYIE